MRLCFVPRQCLGGVGVGGGRGTLFGALQKQKQRKTTQHNNQKNRQCDVGQPKAVVAAERVNARVAGAQVTAHHARIEDMPPDWYSEFTLIVLGLDSLEARRWINSMACSLLGALVGGGGVRVWEGGRGAGGVWCQADERDFVRCFNHHKNTTERPQTQTKKQTEFDDEGDPDPSTIKPLIDGGTEGFKGHARCVWWRWLLLFDGLAVFFQQPLPNPSPQNVSHKPSPRRPPPPHTKPKTQHKTRNNQN
jgi:molybdopterin/thiamine biosynthesis adenylyltransferase